MSGLGTDGIRWIPTDDQLRMDTAALRKQIQADRAAGDRPFLVVGAAGSVSTGAIDPLPAIAAICREYDLWFHVDGAYGGFAAMLPDASPDLRGLSEADSVAVDPHKWLYAPIEAACALVRDPGKLREAFAYHPPYYHFGVEAINYFDFGPQNTRGFRALKVWLAIQQVGREGYVQMLSDDVRLAQELYRRVSDHPALEAFTQSLSITTFRYVPSDLRPGSEEVENYLNQLNRELLTRLQNGGEAYVSNAVIGGQFVLRACIVNFRTSLADVGALPEIVTRLGQKVDAALRPEPLKT
jgi:glutamate/tyrosine decarboxylase-like PLP-dependent enzyme